MDNNMNRFFISLQKLMQKHQVDYTLGTFGFYNGQKKVAVTHIDSMRVVADKRLGEEDEDGDADD